MHRALRVSDYWNWLPAFRVVAESGSLREAASTLNVAASSISRTIRLLEDALGHALFERTKGTLVLNADGQKLLESVRAAMCVVHAAEASEDEDGPCHLFCAPDLVAGLLLDSLEAWLAAHPDRPVLLHAPCADDIATLLLRGDLDAAIMFDAPLARGVSSELLGEFSSGVYRGPRPLRSPGDLDAELAERNRATLPFVDYPVGGQPQLRVMQDRQRQTIAHVPSMSNAAELALRGVGLVCLPDFVAERFAGLERLDWSVPTGRLFVWFRTPLESYPRAAIVEHILGSPAFADLMRGDRAPASRARPSTRSLCAKSPRAGRGA